MAGHIDERDIGTVEEVIANNDSFVLAVKFDIEKSNIGIRIPDTVHGRTGIIRMSADRKAEAFETDIQEFGKLAVVLHVEHFQRPVFISPV